MGFIGILGFIGIYWDLGLGFWDLLGFLVRLELNGRFFNGT